MTSIPRQLRRAACVIRRVFVDHLTSQRQRFAAVQEQVEAGQLPDTVVIVHPVLPSEYVEAKLHNIRLANNRVSKVVVLPGEIFSFWHVIGAPTAQKGFRPGRSLLGGELHPDYGGGLCQLAGLIYYASLVAGLRIIERHAHTIDIYHRAERYAPLGADAAVAYGFKDLRVLNTHTAPIIYRVSIGPNEISCAIGSPQPIARHAIQFEVTEESPTHAVVQTWRSSQASPTRESMGWSHYRRQAEKNQRLS